MNVRLSLEDRVARWAMMAAVLALCGCLLVIVSFNFVVDALSDERIPVTVAASPASFVIAPFTDQRIGVNPGLLAAAARYLPNSSRLQLRLAAFESGQFKEDWNSDELHALRAIGLSPHDYRPRLLLASIQESKAISRGGRNRPDGAEARAEQPRGPMATGNSAVEEEGAPGSA